VNRGVGLKEYTYSKNLSSLFYSREVQRMMLRNFKMAL
jgi:hypothetical protein